MCLHAFQIPASMCSLCTPPPRKVTPGPSARDIERLHDEQRRTHPRAHPTDIILHDDETSARFDAMTTREGSCLVFRGPGNHRQFQVNTTLGTTLTTPTRYAYSRAGGRASADEVVKCSCGRTGEHNGDGLCVDPVHLFAVHHSERSIPIGENE